MAKDQQPQLDAVAMAKEWVGVSLLAQLYGQNGLGV